MKPQNTTTHVNVGTNMSILFDIIYCIKDFDRIIFIFSLSYNTILLAIQLCVAEWIDGATNKQLFLCGGCAHRHLSRNLNFVI